jgi:[ribosomal protein S18]-alanine N-acetyltransferase
MGGSRPSRRLIAPTAEHAPRIAAWSGSSEEARRWCSIAEHPFPPARILQWWQVGDVQPWVLADDAQTPLAYGELWLDQDEDEVEVARVIVDPDRRGAGVGRLLVELLVEAARATRTGGCILRVTPDNAAALRLYASAGFVEVDAQRSAAWNQEQPRNYLWMERPDFGS